MCGEDVRFEIVLHPSLPGGHGQPHRLFERLGRYRRPHACIRLARGNRLIGLHDQQRISSESRLHGPHHLAAARAELRSVAHEKGRIAAQCRRAVDQLRLREPQAEQCVDPLHDRRRIGRAAAQPGPVGHTLVEHDSYGPRTVAFVHQPPGPQADIVLRRTIDRQPQLHEFGFDRRLDLQPVVQLPHRHHYRRHVVESVGPTAKHVQPDIDLAVGS